MTVMTLFNIIYLVTADWTRLFVQVGTLLAFEATVFLYNHFGKNTLARLSVILGVSISIFVDALIGGVAENHQLFYLAMAIGIGIFFEPTNWRLGIALFVIPLGFWLLLEVTNYQMFVEAIPVQSNQVVARYFNILASYSIVFAIVWRFSYLSMVAERRAIQSEKMASLGILASGVGHEINNPIMIINGKISSIRKELGPLSKNPKIEKSFESIERSTKRIETIVKSLSRFSRSNVKDPKSSQNSRELMNACVGLCKHKLTKNNVQIVVDVAEHHTITCRDSEIMQVMVNLINNSIDAVRDLDEKWIKISLEDRHGFSEIKITDSGRGITAEAFEKMTIPFYTTKDPGKGTGLGLSVVDAIVSAHGGELSIDSKASHTTFIVKLPHPTSIGGAA